MSERRKAPWRGRKRVEDPRGKFIGVRCNEKEYANITAAAVRMGLAAGAYLRSVGTGSPGLRAKRRPAVERRALGQVLGLLGRVGSNVNQIARVANTKGEVPGELAGIAADIRAMRAALMEALGRGD